jgi:hypothetical protein
MVFGNVFFSACGVFGKLLFRGKPKPKVVGPMGMLIICFLKNFDVLVWIWKFKNKLKIHFF